MTGTLNSDTNAQQALAISLPLVYRPDERVEPTPKPGFPHHLYPRWIGHKFTAEGQVLLYPGNGVLSPLDPTSALHQSLHALLEDMRKQEWAPLYTFLPPSSWHMTTYEGISDQIRNRNEWPGALDVTSSLKACHAHVATRLADFDHGLGSAGVEMNIAGFESLAEGIALRLVPATVEGEHALRNLRDRLSDRLDMRHPGHNAYSFHMGMGYLLRHLREDGVVKITTFLHDWLSRLPKSFMLSAPEFVVYDDMLAFRRVFSLA